MQSCREFHQWVQVAVVGRFKGVDVVVAIMAGDDDGQVVVLHEVPGDEGPCDPAVAVLEGVYLHEPVVELRRHQRGMVDLGVCDVVMVPAQQVVEFGVDVFGESVLVDDAAGPGRVGLLGKVLKVRVWGRVSKSWLCGEEVWPGMECD